jgi:2-deoxy-D-gluconate 3-dehydrogenase
VPSILDCFHLKGRTALVTGCSRGIGFAMAVGLAEAGADIIGVSTRLAPGSAIERAITGLGRRFTPTACDFSHAVNVTAWAQNLVAVHGAPDILVNNAGTIRRAPAAQHSDVDWSHVLQVNLDSQFRVTREVGAAMLARGSGKIIFTASLLSFQGGINVPGYAASKGAIASLTRALANEWAGRGVNVNAIAPGYIETDNTEELRADPVRSAQILHRIPAGHWGRPEDFKGPVVFLASDAARYVNGEILVVDGGWMGR